MTTHVWRQRQLTCLLHTSTGSPALSPARSAPRCLPPLTACHACASAYIAITLALTRGARLPRPGTAEDIARQLLVYGRRMPKAELFARIDAVDEETVKEVAARFIYDQELAIAALGDTQTLPDYNWFRRRTYWCGHPPPWA